MKTEMRGIERFIETKAFGWVPTMHRDVPLVRWTLWCQGIGACGMVPELVARDVDCNNLSVLYAALRVTARELNGWDRPIDVFCVLEECYWSNTGQQLSFRFADGLTMVELPISATIMDVTDEEMIEHFNQGGA